MRWAGGSALTESASGHSSWQARRMSLYAVRLDLRTRSPLSARRIADLQGGRWDITAIGQPRGRRLAITMSMESSDAVGALIRAQHLILGQQPGDITHAEVSYIGDAPERRRRRRSGQER